MTRSTVDDQQLEQDVSSTGRRDFIKASTAGLVGVASVALAAAPAKAQASGVVEDPKRPAGLGPKAMLDSRFPVMWEDSVPNGVRVLTQFFKALNQRDMQALAATLQFPFGTYEGVKGRIVKSREELLKSPPPSLSMTMTPQRFTDHDGYMKKGAYDVFLGMEVLNWTPVYCCMSMTYDRYDERGMRLLRCEGVYNVTNNNGKWGIELMSTIFTPDSMVGVVFEDSIQQAMRTRRNHTLGMNFEPPDEVTNAFSVQPIGPWYTIRTGDARAVYAAPFGQAMEVYKIKGVQSRLRSHDTYTLPLPTPEERTKVYGSHPVGALGFGQNTPQMRVIHASVDKVHLVGGVQRFNATGEVLSHDIDVQVITQREGRWGNQGTMAHTCLQDRASDRLD